ncbi:hypothetical protein PHYSODRAFT_295079 [Phytophthora sojae]|uniref:Uncharacterized protein n=1 Tax=Phytophthora sojae (strain P6497) TaxID=1094619 RepID=G4YNE1_PHYSP|nr:hypothetical protein PHYSODRAFT_295079 [Phytophthora sojae]EGZ30234.1 hypothetical protein PHYSODRAFT_295079 [Phytophthora sojae]|eukprot:XP_009517509.1 hypothetical protein PHYSODRAFT_295079 [Phytophthora sojae]
MYNSTASKAPPPKAGDLVKISPPASFSRGLSSLLEHPVSQAVEWSRDLESPVKQKGEPKTDPVLLRDVLYHNGKEEFYNQIMKLVHADDDPPVIFEWLHVHEFVQAILRARIQAAVPGGHPVPPPPFAIPNPLNWMSFRAAILTYARDGRSDPVGSICLPCSPAESMRSVEALGQLNTHACVDATCHPLWRCWQCATHCQSVRAQTSLGYVGLRDPPTPKRIVEYPVKKTRHKRTAEYRSSPSSCILNHKQLVVMRTQPQAIRRQA